MSRGSVNKAILIGRLGADPDVRYVPSGSAVANFNIATDHSYKDKDGNFQQQTEWHRIVAWSRLAENSKEYLKKGMRVYVEGRIQTREWQDQNGVKKTTTEIIATDLQILEPLGPKNSNDQVKESDPTNLRMPDNIDSTQDEEVPF